MVQRAYHGPLVLLLTVTVVLTGCSAVPGVSEHTPTPVEPAIVGFTSMGGSCVDQPRLDWSIERSVRGETTIVTVRGNASVPGASYGLTEPTLTATGPSTFALNVTSRRATAKPQRDCPAVASYSAEVRLPRGPEGRFTLVVYHDGREATAVGFDQGGSGPSSVATAGE